MAEAMAALDALERDLQEATRAAAQEEQQRRELEASIADLMVRFASGRDELSEILVRKIELDGELEIVRRRRDWLERAIAGEELNARQLEEEESGIEEKIQQANTRLVQLLIDADKSMVREHRLGTTEASLGSKAETTEEALDSLKDTLITREKEVQAVSKLHDRQQSAQVALGKCCDQLKATLSDLHKETHTLESSLRAVVEEGVKRKREVVMEEQKSRYSTLFDRQKARMPRAKKRQKTQTRKAQPLQLTKAKRTARNNLCSPRLGESSVVVIDSDSSCLSQFSDFSLSD